MGTPLAEIDQYLTAKVGDLVHGALVLKRPTGLPDPKTKGPQYEWILQQPGQGDVILGRWFSAAREAVKLFCRHLRAEAYREEHADDYLRSSSQEGGEHGQEGTPGDSDQRDEAGREPPTDRGGDDRS